MQTNQDDHKIQNVVLSAWKDQARWSELAGRMKTNLNRWRLCASAAGVTGALLETLATVLHGAPETLNCAAPWVALIGAVVLAVIPVITRTKTSSERVLEWVRARSASEALKEMIYRFLVEAKPFGPNPSGKDLVQRGLEIKNKVQDLLTHCATVRPMPRKRPLSLTIDDYIKFRVNDQIENYYRPAGRRNARTAHRLHSLEFWLGLSAVVLGALSASAVGGAPGMNFLATLGPWVGVVTTGICAVTAHLAAARYEYNAIAYLGTANRLESLRDIWMADPNRLSTSIQARFVDDCEQAISSQNESWLVEYTRKKNKAPDQN